MTEDTTEDQSVIYRDYLETVKAFNLANAQHLTTTSERVTERQKAIKRAIKIHIDPVLSTMHQIQLASVAAMILSFVTFSCGSSVTTQDSSAGGIVLILISLGVGAIALLALIWSSSKAAALVKTKNWALQKSPPNIPD